MTDAKVVDNFARVMEKLQRGLEVVVEHDRQPVAMIKAPQFRGRSIDDCISQAEARGTHETLDEDFGRDTGKLSSKVIKIVVWDESGYDGCGRAGLSSRPSPRRLLQAFTGPEEQRLKVADKCMPPLYKPKDHGDPFCFTVEARA